MITATKASTVGGGGTGTIAQVSNSFTINPPAPGAFTITSATANAGGNITLVWSAASNAASYTVTYGTASGGPYGSTASTSATSPYAVSGLTSGTTYYFMVTAVDVTGSTNGSPQVSATSDAAPPTTPGTPTWASSYAITSASSPALSWAASTDAISGVSYYQVALGTSAGGTNVVSWTNIGNTTSYTFTGLTLTNNTAYYATVRAVDAAGNLSTAANSAGFTDDTSAPSTPASPAWAASWSASTSSTPAFTWTASSDSISGISSYKVALGTTAGGTDVVSWTNAGNVTSYTFSGLTLTNGTAYYASVKAVDGAGLTSAAANSAAFTVDTSPPTTPGSPSWAGSYWGYTSTSPAVSWTASTDSGSGVSYYQIALGTTAGAQNVVAWTSIGNVTSYSFSGLTLTNGSSYYATVRAVDAVGNISTAANTSSGSNTTFTVDTAAPNPPTAVTNAYTTTSTTSAPALSWTASTSNGAADFAGYQVALGTTAGGTDILTWTNVGNVTSYTPSTGFTLINGTAYYPSVRAYKSTNLTSTTANGNQFAVVTETPTLNFNFLSGSTPMTSTNSTYPSMIQFSRASGANVSPGTYYNSSGVIITAPANYVKASQNLSASPWTLTDVTLSVGATAPDGTSTATQVIENNDSGVASYHYPSMYNVTVPTAGVPYTCSIYAAAGARSKFTLTLQTSNGVSGVSTTANVGAGTTTAGGSFGSGTGAASGITSVGNGWYRVWISGTLDSSTTATTCYPLIYSGASNHYAGDGSSGIYFWGGQIEQGSTPSSYIYTTTAAAYGPRFDYNPSTLALNGLLIEESRTNLALQSANFSTSWTTSASASIGAGTATAPDGSSSASLLTSSATGYRSLSQTVTVANDTLPRTFSLYVNGGSSNGPTVVKLQYTSGTGGSAQVSVPWPNPSNGSAYPAGPTYPVTYQALQNGWYRISVTLANNGGTSLNMIVYPANNATGSVNIWGAQLEQGAMPTSYIPTTSTAMTRAGDYASISTSSGSWYNSTIGTFFPVFKADSTAESTVPFMVWTDANNYMRLYVDPSANITARDVVGGSFLISNVLGTYNPNTVFSGAYAYQLNNFAATYSGNTPTIFNSATVPSVTSLLLGQGTAGPSGRVWLQSLSYYNSRLSNSAIQQLTH